MHSHHLHHSAPQGVFLQKAQLAHPRHLCWAGLSLLSEPPTSLGSAASPKELVCVCLSCYPENAYHMTVCEPSRGLLRLRARYPIRGT